jgi:glyoxylase-like metal-dependent hydrolase (beta-lactamase superfamily II)
VKVHHLNCVSACPLGGALMDGFTRDSLRGRLTSHCLLIEADRELVLIDTGYGLQDIAHARTRLSAFFRFLSRPDFREEMTAIRQIEALGFDPRDVRHIVLSHLDFDHAGGLDDFPWARVHLLAEEVDAASAQSTLLDRMRYRPQQWSTRNRWQTYSLPGGESWYGFDAVGGLADLDVDLFLIPLEGHTLGHAAVAVRYGEGWILYAADAYFYHAEMDVKNPRCTPGLRFYQTLMEKDRSRRLGNQKRLRQLVETHGDEVSVFCAHDVVEFERLALRSYQDPPEPPEPVLGESLAVPAIMASEIRRGAL